MNEKRLLNVIKAIEESPNPKMFSMRSYSDCGTPACAMGHYAARRDLQKTFRLDEDGNVVTNNGSNLWACENHFGITPDEDEELFGLTGCGDAKTPKQAIRYIRKFIARKKAEK
jgi:hypothetical protein